MYLKYSISLVNFYQGRRDDEVPSQFPGILLGIKGEFLGTVFRPWQESFLFTRPANKIIQLLNTRKGVEKKSTMDR